MTCKVCLIQDSPIFFNKEQTLQKLETLVIKYAAEKCELIVFPESFIPGYPRGFNFGATIGSRTTKGRKLYSTYYKNSINLNGNDKEKVEKIAQKNNVHLVIGVTEQGKNNGSLYCSMIYISPTHGILGVHRKIKPTGTERLIWAEAAGDSLICCDTPVGRLGGLICWENYMPLARMAMYQKAVEIYIAPTADARDEWTASMQHIALEGRCFVLACNQYMTKSMYPEEYLDELSDEPELMCRGGSVIISPLGKIIAGPFYHESGALIAEIDLNEVAESKLDFDVVGHYSRDDIFKYEVVGQPDIIVDKIID